MCRNAGARTRQRRRRQRRTRHSTVVSLFSVEYPAPATTNETLWPLAGKLNILHSTISHTRLRVCVCARVCVTCVFGACECASEGLVRQAAGARSLFHESIAYYSQLTGIQRPHVSSIRTARRRRRRRKSPPPHRQTIFQIHLLPSPSCRVPW